MRGIAAEGQLATTANFGVWQRWPRSVSRKRPGGAVEPRDGLRGAHGVGRGLGAPGGLLYRATGSRGSGEAVATRMGAW